MELTYLMDNMMNGGINRKDTRYDLRRAEYVLDLLLQSKEVEEVFDSAQKGIDPRKVRENFTDKLIDFQEEINRYEPGLGQEIAKNLNKMVDKVGYFSLLGLMDYLTEYLNKINFAEQEDKTESIALLKEMPKLIESIKGNNGLDSKVLRHYFVSLVLPKKEPRTVESAQKLAENYRKKSADLSQPTETAQEYQTVCKNMYGGDYDLMKREVFELIKGNLQKFLRKIRKIEEAQALDSALDDIQIE